MSKKIKRTQDGGEQIFCTFFVEFWADCNFRKTKKQFQKLETAFHSGGQGGIRTLDTLLTYTRVPVVRLRPAQPPVHL